MRLTFDFSSATPLYQQLRDQIVVAIADGRLRPGEQLPTVRALSAESGVNRMTISKAYQVLAAEGFITTDRRNGATVCGGRERGTVPEATVRKLKLQFAELRLRGFSEEEILALCRSLCSEGDEKWKS